MKKLLAVLILLLLIPVTPARVNAKSDVRKFKNCTLLNRVYPRGVARNQFVALLVRAKYSPSLYRANSNLDRDKDGIACERVSSGNPNTTSSIQFVPPVAFAPSSSSSTTIPVTCSELRNKVNIQNFQISTLSNQAYLSLQGISTSFEVSREVKGEIRNDSSKELYVVGVIAKSLFRNGLNPGSQFYEVDNLKTVWITPIPKIAPNSTAPFTRTFTQYVMSPYGPFVDSFDSSIEFEVLSSEPDCSINK